MNTRPDCPKCVTNTHVRSTGGGTNGKYYYTCKLCKAEWMQYPSNSEHVIGGGDIEVTFKKSKRSQEYHCSKCGQPKKGHNCPNKKAKMPKQSEMAFVPVPTAPPIPDLPDCLGLPPLTCTKSEARNTEMAFVPVPTAPPISYLSDGLGLPPLTST